MNSRLFAILAVLFIAIIGGAMYFLSSPQDAPVEVTTEVAVATPGPVTPKSITVVRPKDAPVVPRLNTSEPLAPVTETAPALADWEIKIDQVLRANADESQTAQMLINMLPTLPKDGQTEAAQHVTNLVLDKDYGRILPLLKNPALSQDVLDVFVTDLMNREDEVKLPAMLGIAKIPNHPHREEALADLQIFLDEDHGTDWAKWEAAMKGYLKRQAAENAAAESLIPGGVPPAQ
jgi:hypothetical protein